MRRLLCVLSFLLIGSSATAQNWVVVDGTNKLTVNSPNTAVTIRQVGTGKVLTIQGSAGTDLWSVDNLGNVSQLGVPTFGGALNLGTTSTNGFVLKNTTPATAGATVQISPRACWSGTAWNSSSSASETNQFCLEVLPATVAGTTTATLKIGYIAPNGTVTYPGTLSSAGAFTTLGALKPTGTTASALAIDFNGSNRGFFDDGSETDLAAGSTAYWGFRGDRIYSKTGNGDVEAIIKATTMQITAGADVTSADTGTVTRQRYQATITPASGGAGNCGPSFLAAALTADCAVATIPAGQKLVAAYADVTVGFTCSGTCSGTKVVQCGTAVNGTQILAASLNVATTATYGLADADLGSGMTRAAAIQGGLIGSWSATTPVSCRFTSGTGNWGNAATTFVNAGSIKFTLITEQIK